MEINYNGKVVAGQHLSTEETQIVPVVQLKGLDLDTNKKYVLIMNDPNAVGGNRIHWIVYGIRGNQFYGGTHLLYYRGPAPPKNSGIHNYIFSLYEMTDDVHLFLSETDRRINMDDLLIKLGIGNDIGRPIYSVKFTSQKEGTFQNFYILLRKYTGLLLLVIFVIVLVILYIFFLYKKSKRNSFF
jgi:hypothetical protein